MRPGDELARALVRDEPHQPRPPRGAEDGGGEDAEQLRRGGGIASDDQARDATEVERQRPHGESAMKSRARVSCGANTDTMNPPEGTSSSSTHCQRGLSLLASAQSAAASA